MRSHSVLACALVFSLAALACGFLVAPNTAMRRAQPQRLPQAQQSLGQRPSFGQRMLQQRHSKQLHFQIFGLGTPEIIVVLAVGALLFGPDKLSEMARTMGKAAGELKEVPKEFAEGIREGETEAQKEKSKALRSREVQDTTSVDAQQE